MCKVIHDIHKVTDEIREKVVVMYQENGLEHLQDMLSKLDPEYYAIVDRMNPKRVMHALEICIQTGRTYTSFRKNEKKERDFRIIKVGLTRDRQMLYERINKRVDMMVEDGLIDEARRVIDFRTNNSLNTVGYKEIFKYIDGEWTLDFALEKIKQNTRIYSRKQVTWFKRDEEIKWFDADDEEALIKYLEQII